MSCCDTDTEFAWGTRLNWAHVTLANHKRFERKLNLVSHALVLEFCMGAVYATACVRSFACCVCWILGIACGLPSL